MRIGRTLSRRGFLATVGGMYVVSARGGAPQPADRITLGCIGVGGRGKQNLQNFLSHDDCRVVAVCDVNRKRAAEAADIVNAHYANTDCKVYHDYRDLLARDDIDAVSIGSPDQWHVLQSVEAARAGKDVFLEKPLGLSVEENRALREAIRRYDRVFQFGTQQRSDRNFRHACELVLNERIGKLKNVVVSTPPSRVVDSYRPSPAPPELDYEMWVGPARWTPYTQGVTFNCGQWGHISNFSLGWITTWGIHHIDIAQWGLDADRSGPVRVEGSGVFPEDGLYDCATAWQMRLTYGNGVTVDFIDHKKRLQGVLFEGSEGSVFVRRGGIEAEPESLLQAKISADENRLPASNDHWRNFLDCIKSRSTPVSSIDAAVRSDTVCHLCDIAMRLGRPLRWDPYQERFIDDAQANHMLRRAMRSPWHL